MAKKGKGKAGETEMVDGEDGEDLGEGTSKERRGNTKK
jgi:hypothetical protein